MAKKKQIPDMPDMSISDFIRFIINLPKDEQQQMLDLLDMIESMPEGEKNDLFDGLLLNSIFDGDDKKYFDGATKKTKSMNDMNTNEPEFDCDNYPHSLPREKVEKYTLRVTLQGIKPSIFRKFNVPSNISLRHLSELIIDLMGWRGEHLNHFRKGDNYYAPAYQREGEMPIMFCQARNFNQEDFVLSDLLSEKGKSIEWEYDFGDSWCHDVRLSSIGEYSDGEPLISFIQGKRACPPEDCGGVWGYQELLELRAKKEAHKRLTNEEKERLEWYELDDLSDPMLSPEYFDLEDAQEICEYFCE